MEHILVVECAMQRHLPVGAEVHHVNGNRADNGNQNLIACEGQGYHRLLHFRAAALVATGDPNKRKCGFCDCWDDQSKLFVKRRCGFYHRACKTGYQRQRRLQQKRAMQMLAGIELEEET